MPKITSIKELPQKIKEIKPSSSSEKPKETFKGAPVNVVSHQTQPSFSAQRMRAPSLEANSSPQIIPGEPTPIPIARPRAEDSRSSGSFYETGRNRTSEATARAYASTIQQTSSREMRVNPSLAQNSTIDSSSRPLDRGAMLNASQSTDNGEYVIDLEKDAPKQEKRRHPWE